MTTIQELNPDLLDRAGVTLAEAFETDPMFEWLFPDPATRATLSLKFSEVPLRYGHRFGHITESSDAQAVSIWMPPERPLSIMGLVRCGMLGMPLKLGFGPFSRFLSANAVMDEFHKKHVPEPHWYLFAIGVSPNVQGRGLGSALIRDGLEKADLAGCPCYLETSSPRNVPFYKSFGFRVVGEAPLGKDGPTGWAMRRDLP